MNATVITTKDVSENIWTILETRKLETISLILYYYSFIAFNITTLSNTNFNSAYFK